VDVLIIGGTGFLGRHLVEAALGKGHKVTLFNRGLREPGLFPNVETIEGDREADLPMLRGRRWDAAIDTCGYVPRVVRASAGMLADAVDHYTFVSSISVYSDGIAPGADEEAPVQELADEEVEEVTGETYGGLKVLCELVAGEEMSGRVLNVRPGLISGPHDPTDRFTYWPRRISAGGNGGAELVWVSEEFLEEHGVEPYTELPLWLPREYGALQAIYCGKAIAAGLAFRPLSETITDVLEWDRTRGEDERQAAGLGSERERELLQAWQGATL
jgi:2'-hydroxyisoflavone reductase